MKTSFKGIDIPLFDGWKLRSDKYNVILCQTANGRELVRKICLSSMPYDRYKFFQLLAKHEGRLTTEIIQKELSCSDETARKTMKTFEVLGIVTIKSLPIGEGRPMFYIEIKPEFQELLNETQKGTK